MTTTQWYFFFGIVLLGIIFRWMDLETRPLHHDESLFAIYGRYFFDRPDSGYYRYDPMLHGPLVFHLLPIIYQFFGFSKTAIRIIPCVLGTLFIFAPLLFRKYFQPMTFLFITAFISLSPTLIYWSRYLRQDYLTFAAMILVIYGATISPPRWKATWIISGFTIQACNMENIYVTIPIISGYLVFEIFMMKIFPNNKSLLQDILSNFKDHFRYWIAAVFIGIGIYIYFYTSAFYDFSMLFRGVFPTGLTYWWHQHSIERISGPFSIHFFMFAWYEHIFLLILLIYLLHFYLQNSTRSILGLIIFWSAFVFSMTDPQNVYLWKFLKLKLDLDIFLAFFIFCQSIITTTAHLKENQRGLAFWGYLFWASFFSYSYIGEKVPWIATYALLPGIIYLSLYLQHYSLIDTFFKNTKTATIISSLALLFTVRMAFITNFQKAGAASEYISQVHTSSSYEKLLHEFQNKFGRPLVNTNDKLFVDGENTWPTSWYLYGLSQYLFHLDKSQISDFKYVLLDQNNHEYATALNLYTKSTIPLRWWWVPDYQKMTFLNFMKYSLFHQPWSTTGSSNSVLYVAP